MSRGEIPSELRSLSQWVVWRYEEREGQRTKVPYRPASPSVKASTTDPATWSSYQTATAIADVDGKGLVFAEGDGLAGVDLDHCIVGDGKIDPFAAAIVLALDSYTERSPSGRGLHVIIRAELNGGRRRTGNFEVYDRGRFFCVTGDHVKGTPTTVNERQAELDEVRAEVFPPSPEPPKRTPGIVSSTDDHELLELARNAKNGSKFEALYFAGEHNYPSDSEADLALCSMLGFWFVGPDRIDRAFRGSARMRDKWDERHGESTDGERTIARALEGRTEFYAPRERSAHAPNPKSTERTERSTKNPANTGEKRSVEDRTVDRTLTERSGPPDLASEERILSRLDDAMGTLGLVGERHLARAAYLVHVSRLLPDPARAVVKGDSSTGKSFAVDCALAAAAPEFLWARTSTSPLALFYSEESFCHRTLVVYEANKLGDDDDDFARVLRTLLSEGKLRHEVTDVKRRTSVLLEKEGPVAFISTVARASLDKEVETRILSLHSDGSDAMTENVVRALLNDAAEPRPGVDLSEWHALDRWLASEPADVVVPWGPALAGFNLSGPPRLRRDVTNLLALARAHALLHRATRSVDARGRVIATLDDYEVVCDLLADALAIATDKAVRPGTRAVVEAVAALREEGKTPVSLKAAARKAKRSSSTTHTDVHDALDRDYLVNRSQNGRSYDLDVGDPLSDQGELLPSRADLEARLRGERSVSVRSAFGRRPNAPGPVNTGDLGNRSVRSVDSEGEGREP